MRKYSLCPAFVWLTAIFVISGCAGRFEQDARKVAAGAYAEAVTLSQGDKERERHLAALLVQEALISQTMPRLQASQLLLSQRRYGVPLLSRLSRSNTPSPVPELAETVLASRRGMKERQAAEWIQSDWYEIRTLAVSSVGHRLSDEQLNALLLDTAPEVRAAAVRSLCAKHPSAARAERIADALRLDPDPSVRATAAGCSKALQNNAVEFLASALVDPAREVRHAAISSLGEIAAPSARAHLDRLSAQALSEDTVLAAVALAQHGSASGEARFREALKSNDGGIRATALVHLARLEIVDALDLRVMSLADQEPQVRFLAASALLADKRNRPRAIDALKELRSGGGEYSLPARRRLAREGVSEDLKELQRSLRQLASDDPAALAAQVSACTDVAGLRTDFVVFMGHTDAHVRLAAAIAVLSMD